MSTTTDRLAVLARIWRIVGNRAEEGRVRDKQIFCIKDGEPIEANIWQPEGYRHGNHVHPRAFIFDPQTRWEFRPDGELQHHVAGSILWREDHRGRRYCLFRRETFPAGYYTIPAGHVEVGEEPLAAALREAFEETHLGVLSAELFFEGEISDQCRRGADYHAWHAYLCRCVGEPQISEEADVIGWYGRGEIVNELNLTRPTGLLFGQLFGETPRHVRDN